MRYLSEMFDTDAGLSPLWITFKLALSVGVLPYSLCRLIPYFTTTPIGWLKEEITGLVVN